MVRHGFFWLFLSLIGCGGLFGGIDGIDSNGKSPDTSTTTSPDSSSPKLNLLDGNNQSGIVRQTAAKPLSVQAVGVDGTPIANATIEFVVEKGAGDVIVSSPVMTDDSGKAQTTVTLGSRAEDIVIRATWNLNGSSSQSVDFHLSAHGLLAAFVSGQVGSDQRASCAGEAESYSQPVVLKITDDAGNPAPGTSVQLSVLNGSINNLPFQASLAKSTDAQGKISVNVTAGSVPDGQYLNSVTLTASVPDVPNVPPATANLTVTKLRYLLPLSPPIQYADGTPGVVNWDFTFAVKILDKCNQPATGQTVTYDYRYSVPQSMPCGYDPNAQWAIDWQFKGTAVTGSDGIASYTTQYRVRWPIGNYVFPVFNQVRATAVGTQSATFDATSGICQ